MLEVSLVKPSMLPCAKAAAKIYTELVNAGANVNAKAYYGNTPLLCTIREGYANIIKLLSL